MERKNSNSFFKIKEELKNSEFNKFWYVDGTIELYENVKIKC